MNQNKDTTCLSNYCARRSASAWAFLLVVSSLGGPFLVMFEVRELPAFPSSTEECECNAITSISLLNALYSFVLSLTVTLIWRWQLFLLTYFQPHVSPQVPPSLQPPIPLLPGADVALQAAFSPVSMTTRMTSAWGLKITVRTPNQLNANKTFLIAVEIFLVTKKKKVGGSVRRCRRWWKNSLSSLAAYAVMTTLRFPQAPQQFHLLSEIIFSHPWSSCLHPRCRFDQLQMLGWPLMSGLIWSTIEVDRGVTWLLPWFPFSEAGKHTAFLRPDLCPRLPLMGWARLWAGCALCPCQCDATVGKKRGGRCAAGMSPWSSCRRRRYRHAGTIWLRFACLCGFLYSPWSGIAQGELPGAAHLSQEPLWVLQHWGWGPMSDLLGLQHQHSWAGKSCCHVSTGEQSKYLFPT